MDIRVNLGPRSYDIHVTSNDGAGVGAFTRQRTAGSQAFLVTDDHVASYANTLATALEQTGFRTTIAKLLPGETQKSLVSAAYLYDRLAEMAADRKTVIVAIGGGVIGDLAGFVAATYVRGLPLLMVPTTLLAMVDSAVGGKVGINHPRAKNLIGAFHQPAGVWIDTAALDTLPDREYRSGLAEVVKYGVILDEEFFTYLERHAEAIMRRQPEAVQHIVARSCRLKADIVERDEREETGLRALLNYGHTFAHAFETVSGYGTWLHGEAVAAGMICASRLAERLGLIPREVTERQRQLLTHFGLPTALKQEPVVELLACMRNDKKSLDGRLRFVLPRRVGEAMLINDVSESEVIQILESAIS